MRLFSPLYERALTWAGHRHARWYLAGLSFAESSFFPIPPDVMLAPMTLARPAEWLRYALITTVSSVAGGIAGWLIGSFAIEWAEPFLLESAYAADFLKVQTWFEDWGFAAVLIAGFSPIPYKLFTIAAGTMGMALPGFVLASAVGRGARFFLVAGLVRWGGSAMEQQLRRHVETIGWVVVVLLTGAILVLH